MGDRPTRGKLREAMTRQANTTRDIADEMAQLFGGCDDPLHPLAHPDGFRNWQDFVDRIARPLVGLDVDHETEQAAMALYRKASPFSICVAMVMMANRLDRLDPPAGEATTEATDAG